MIGHTFRDNFSWEVHSRHSGGMSPKAIIALPSTAGSDSSEDCSKAIQASKYVRVVHTGR